VGSILDDLNNFISVDIEAAGPIPAQYALLSIGACTVTQPRRTFYVELIPDKDQTDPHAMKIHGLDLARLAVEGLSPEQALRRFADWLGEVVPPGRSPLMVAFNSPFDWMFINDYFYRYLGTNPFGHSTIDIKAVYMGASGKSWAETSGLYLHRLYHPEMSQLTHNALEDAISQGTIFEGILKEFFFLK
jgi:DNA polymerase III epsilon subunit-like protein